MTEYNGFGSGNSVGLANGADASSYQLATAFATTLSGQSCKGIRLWIDSTKTQTQIDSLLAVYLYPKGSGAYPTTPALATVTVAAGTFAPGSGYWAEVRFATPAALTANTAYFAAVKLAGVSGGLYSAKSGYFSSADVNAPSGASGLVFLKDGTGASGLNVGNGSYNTTNTSPPNSTFGAAFYGIDVIMDDGSSPGSSSSMTSASSLSGSATNSTTGTSSMASSSTLAGTATNTTSGSSGMASASSLTGSAQAQRAGTSVMTSASSLTGTGQALRRGTSTMASVSTLSGSATRTTSAAGDMVSGSSLSGAPTQNAVVASTMASASSLTGSLGGPAGSAAMTSASSLSGAANQGQTATSTMASVSALAGDAGLVEASSAAMASSSTLTGSTTAGSSSSASMASGSSLTGSGTAQLGGNATMTSASALTGSATVQPVVVYIPPVIARTTVGNMVAASVTDAQAVQAVASTQAQVITVAHCA